MFGVPSEPDSGEMAPTEFGLNDIATGVKGVADSNSVVAAAAVILGALVLGSEIAAIVLVVVLVPHFTITENKQEKTHTLFKRKE